MNRGFEVVRDDCRVFPDVDIELPVRKTKHSAAYDFVSLTDRIIEPGHAVAFPLDIKAKMEPDEILVLNVRSSIGFKKKLMLVNTQGWVDSDYYNNPDNDGNIGICLYNFGDKAQHIQKGDRIAQGMFLTYLTVDNEEEIKTVRQGGIGSTGK